MKGFSQLSNPNRFVRSQINSTTVHVQAAVSPNRQCILVTKKCIIIHADIVWVLPAGLFRNQLQILRDYVVSQRATMESPVSDQPRCQAEVVAHGRFH